MPRRIKIQVSDLRKKFGTKEVLKGLTFNIYEGESVVIIGGSGCGKTVLIKLLSSLLGGAEGSIKIEGKEIVKKKMPEYNPAISFLFQLNALFDSYPIWKNVCLAKIENEGMKKAEAIELCKKVLALVGLSEDVAFLYPSDISGGMQKRASLARCLTSNPEIIFFDEPTSGLDPLTSQKISELIRNLGVEEKKKITKISIMHDIDCARIVADRVIYLHEGRVEWIGTIQEMETTDNKNLINFIRRGD